MKRSQANRLVLGILLLGVLIQAYFVVDGYALRWVKAAWRTRDQGAHYRSARFLYGSRGANFLAWLDSSIPEDAPVVVPEIPGPSGEQSNLQFFLLPRGIPACPCASSEPGSWAVGCLTCLRTSENFIPAVGEFPPGELLAEDKIFVPHAEDTGWYHGFFAPLTYEPVSLNEVGFGQSAYPFGAIPVNLFLFMFVGLAGFLLVRLLAPPLRLTGSIALALPVGIGTVTWPIFLMSWSGIPLSIWLFGGVILVTVFFSGALLVRRGKPIFPEGSLQTMKTMSRNPLALVVGALLAGLIAAATVIAVGRGYSLFDGIANWALKGYGIALERSVFAGETRGGHGLSYPQNLHLIIAMFRLMDGDVLPGSKLIFPSFLLSLCLICYSFWRWCGSSPEVGWLGAGLLMTTPVLFYHSTIGWANLPLTAYLVGGCLVGVEATIRGHAGMHLLSGLLLALAAWTRPEGIGYAVVAVLVILAARRFQGVSLRSLSSWTLPILIIGGSYLLFSRTSMAEDNIGQALHGFLQHVSSGGLTLVPLALITRGFSKHFLSIDYWALLFPLSFAGLLIGRHKLRGAPMPALVGLMLAFVIAPVTLFFVRYFSRSGYYAFVLRSFDRAFFPGAVLIAVLGIAALGSWHASLESRELEHSPTHDVGSTKMRVGPSIQLLRHWRLGIRCKASLIVNGKCSRLLPTRAGFQ